MTDNASTSNKLKGKVAIVSAAAGAGIGQAVAARFGHEGATVVITDSHERRVGEAAARLSRDLGREVQAFKVDVRENADIVKCVEATMMAHGKIDILFNNAGINKIGPFWELSDEEWQKILDVNLSGTFRFSRAVAPHMIDRKSGVIINVSSIAGWMSNVGRGGQAAYAAVKAGVMGFTRATATDLGPYGIRVNAIAPGLVYNEFLEKLHDKPWFEEKRKETVLGRMGKVEDITAAAVYLASDDSSFITGEVLNVSGGWYMHA